MSPAGCSHELRNTTHTYTHTHVHTHGCDIVIESCLPFSLPFLNSVAQSVSHRVNAVQKLPGTQQLSFRYIKAVLRAMKSGQPGPCRSDPTHLLTKQPWHIAVSSWE